MDNFLSRLSRAITKNKNTNGKTICNLNSLITAVTSLPLIKPIKQKNKKKIKYDNKKNKGYFFKLIPFRNIRKPQKNTGKRINNLTSHSILGKDSTSTKNATYKKTKNFFTNFPYL